MSRILPLSGIAPLCRSVWTRCPGSTQSLYQMHTVRTPLHTLAITHTSNPHILVPTKLRYPHLQSRTYAVEKKEPKKKPEKGKGGPGGSGAASLAKGWDALKVFKDQPGPTELPDDQYPSWLWDLERDLPPTEELLAFARKLYMKGGAKAVVEGMDPYMFSVLKRRMSDIKMRAINSKKSQMR